MVRGKNEFYVGKVEQQGSFKRRRTCFCANCLMKTLKFLETPVATMILTVVIFVGMIVEWVVVPCIC